MKGALVFALSSLLLSSCCKEEEVPDRNKFFGTYDCSEQCDSGDWSYVLTITESTSGGDAIILGNFGGYGINLKGTVTGDSFILEQTEQGVMFNSTGTMEGNSLSFNYSANDGENSDSCTGTGTKL